MNVFTHILIAIPMILSPLQTPVTESGPNNKKDSKTYTQCAEPLEHTVYMYIRDHSISRKVNQKLAL